jgi:hypothetical protein
MLWLRISLSWKLCHSESHLLLSFSRRNVQEWTNMRPRSRAGRLPMYLIQGANTAIPSRSRWGSAAANASRLAAATAANASRFAPLRGRQTGGKRRKPGEIVAKLRQVDLRQKIRRFRFGRRRAPTMAAPLRLGIAWSGPLRSNLGTSGESRTKTKAFTPSRVLPIALARFALIETKTPARTST